MKFYEYLYICVPSIRCFARVGGMHSKQNKLAMQASMSKFMHQSPCHVARFVSIWMRAITGVKG